MKISELTREGPGRDVRAVDGLVELERSDDVCGQVRFESAFAQEAWAWDLGDKMNGGVREISQEGRVYSEEVIRNKDNDKINDKMR